MARQYKLARKMKKITLTAAARELGVTQPALSSWESERKAPSIEALIRMAKFYGVTTDFLLGLSQEADPRKDWLEPIDPSLIPVLHETPVFSPTRGWAFVDCILWHLFLCARRFPTIRRSLSPNCQSMMKCGWNQFPLTVCCGKNCVDGTA